jgi:putative ATP-dependent endonuclease of the OLD family
MKLVSFTVQNFRCYQVPFKVKVDSFTAIMGKNDIGKSALFEALSIFFEQSKMDQNDASVGGDAGNVKITCEFSDLPESLIIDAENLTTLTDEHLLNESGNLEITKTYNATLTSPRISKICATALHPTAESFSDLLTLKRAELITRAKDLGVDLEAVNKSVNAELRTALWAAANDLELALCEVDLQKEAGKQAWAALSKYLPTFWLFKSDRASTDQDEEAQDPLNAAIAQAVKAVEGDLEAITDRVRAEVNKVAALTLEKLSEMDANLAATLDPVVRTKKWEAMFQTSVTGDNGIPLNKRGSGVRRLILLNFFRAQVEARAAETSNASVIYAIEEPETSQHPRNQRLLLSTLQRLTTDPTRQVMVTTHTPMLARAVPDSQLRFIHGAGPNRSLASGGAALTGDIAKSLGVLADHSVKAFIGVEGPNDIMFLAEIAKMLSQAGESVVNLESLEANGEVIFIPLGGSCLALWADRLQALNRPEIHICDRDNPPGQEPKYAAHAAAVDARDGCSAYITTKREMENYIHPQAIAEAYQANGVEVELPPSFADFDDVPMIVARALHVASSPNAWEGLSADKQKGKASKAKKVINGAAARRMNVARLKETGGYEEITAWLKRIEEMIQG